MSNLIYEITDPDGTAVFICKSKRICCEEQDRIHRYDELKFVRIGSGSAVWLIDDREYPVKKGDILILSHADIRMIKQVSSPLQFTQLDFLPAAIYPRQDCTACFYKRTPNFSNKLDKTHPSFSAVNAHFNAILKEFSTPKPYQREAVLTHLTQMVIAAARMYADAPADTSVKLSHSASMEQAICYIRTHLSAPLNLPDTAKAVGLSPAYFSRLFKAYTGVSFRDYVARLRVTKVIELLQTQSVNVLDAALCAGFQCSSGFYRTFRTATGSTPKAFRKR